MKKKEPVNLYSLLIALLSLILGIFLCLNGGENVKNLIGYFVSGILLITGFIKLIVTITRSKKYGGAPFGEYVYGIVFLIFGLLIALNPGIVVLTISVCIGALLLFLGIQRLIMGITVNKIDKNGSLFYILESVLIILLGIIIITGKAFSFLGILLIVYSLMEIVSYVYYTTQNKEYSKVLNKEVTKEMKDSEAKEAVIEEE